MRGFTLIELLVVMTIIGILTSIALPQFGDYRKSAFDLRASFDIRNVAIAEEAYFITAEHYLSCADSNCTTLPGIGALSPGVTLAIQATTTGFSGTSTHPLGTGIVYSWNSSTGGLKGN